MFNTAVHPTRRDEGTERTRFRGSTAPEKDGANLFDISDLLQLNDPAMAKRFLEFRSAQQVIGALLCNVD